MYRTLFSVAFASAAIASLTVGCGTGGGSSGAGGSDALSACKGAYTSIRAGLSRCFPGFVSATPDPAEADFAARECVNDLAAPGSATQASNISACADAYKSVSCETLGEAIGNGSGAIPACKFPKGTLAVGAPCGADAQCTGVCNRPQGKNCGVCAAAAKEGEACGTTRCEEGLQCVPATDKCAKRAATVGQGAACDDTVGPKCNTSLDCGADKKCPVVPKLGEACTSLCADSLCDFAGTKKCIAYRKVGESCTGFDCEQGIDCSGPGGAKKCTAPVKVKPGGDCSGDGTTCEIGQCGLASKKCPQVLAEGAACTSDTGTSVCANGLECLDNKCAIRNASLCK
jgi:hypothetical protein